MGYPQQNGERSPTVRDFHLDYLISSVQGDVGILTREQMVQAAGPGTMQISPAESLSHGGGPENTGVKLSGEFVTETGAGKIVPLAVSLLGFGVNLS